MRGIRYNAWDKYFKTMCRVNAIDFSLKTARLLPIGSYDPKSIYGNFTGQSCIAPTYGNGR